MARGHVCVLTTAHPTDDVRVNSRMVRAFLAAGYRVSWVGPDNAYFTETSTPEADVDYHLFRPNSSRLRRLGAGRAAGRAAAGVRDVDWWYSPDPDAAAVATKVARRQGGRVLFDIHEVFHLGLLDRWFAGRTPRVVRELVRRRIARTCRKVDLVTGVSEAVMQPYLAPGAARVLTRNCAPRFFAEVGGASLRADGGPLRVMHGKAIAGNGTPRVLDALAEIDRSTAERLRVHFTRVPAGEFAETFERRVQSLPHPEVAVVADGVPHEAMPALLAEHHVGMVAYQRDLGLDSLPNRLFEYMASGLAVLAPSYSSEIVEILEAEDAGIVADFEDDAAISRALTWLVEHPDEVAQMGRRAREAFLARYNWDAEAEKLIAAMEGMEGR